MFKKFLLKPKNFFAASSLILLCAVFSHLIICIVNFPSEIHLLAGQENNIALHVPFGAIIETDSIAVVNVNDEQVKDNIKVDLNKDISINSQDDAEMNMQVSLFGIPVKSVSLDVIPDMEVVPVGMTVGVQFYTNGVMVLGTGAVTGKEGTVCRPSDGILKSGDLIMEVNGKVLDTQNQLIEIVEGMEEKKAVSIKIDREGEELLVSVEPVVSKEDGKKKIGVWVRDSTQGIGTITYYNPQSKKFGALGHGILDVDTKKLMTVKSGKLLEAEIMDIRKGKKGSPGELVGEINKKEIIGSIKINTELGLYGNINSSYKDLPQDAVKIALQGDIHEGPAVIRSNIEGNKMKDYDVYIESVNKYSAEETKGMVVRITDQELITRTNGIVQGMSGSPILQDGKLIGAVTHVFVQNPLKGYGIFIENMIKQERSA